MLSRRRFVAGLTSGLGLAWPGIGRAARASGTQPTNTSYRAWLLQILPSTDRTFDPLARLVVTPATPFNVHSRVQAGDVHAIRPSLAYAAALFDTREGWRLARAREILRSVGPLQDQDPASPTYGLWPWYLEEPLARMAHPDPSSAGFCAAALLMIWTGHSEDLDHELQPRVRDGILHAARAIQRRDDSLAETHLAILEAGVTLAAAQEFRDAALRAQAKARLRRLYDYVLRQGSFDEYNSPSHTILALQELSRMLLLLRDARDRSLVATLHALAWKHVSAHFHAPTQQWAGPFSRAAETNLAAAPATLAFLQKATDGNLRWSRAVPSALSLEAGRLPLACPQKYARLFGPLEKPRQVTETFVRAGTSPGARNAVVGTTWLHPRYALGSVNRGDLWGQRRPLVAHWGTPEAPRFLRVRFLKDQRDFSSALLFSAQHQGHVLAAVVFAIDHGDRHPTLDPLRNGMVQAQDLRLCFQFGGELGHCTVQRLEGEEKALVIGDDHVRFVLRLVCDRFGDASWRWEAPELKLADRIETVAYAGAEKQFQLATLGNVFLCFAFSEWPQEQPRPPASRPEWRADGGRCHARWTIGERTLDLNVPSIPGPFAELNDGFRALVG